MSVAQLYNIPRSPPAGEVWSFANADSHNLMIMATQRIKQITLIRYVLSPVTAEDLDAFLEQHQQSHNDLYSVWGIGGDDFSDLNPNDPQALEEVFFLHATAHNQLHQVMGI